MRVHKERLECPTCGSRKAISEGPGPGQGGLFRISCPSCGFEQEGIADPARGDWEGSWEEPGEPPEDDVPLVRVSMNEEVVGRCEVCGKPGKVQNLPGGVPFSGCFCDEHVPIMVIKPLPILLALVAALVAALLIWILP